MRYITRNLLAKTAGVPVSTIEFYCSQGLVCGETRIARLCLYDESAVDRVREILRLREEGKSVEEIRSAFVKDA